MAKRGVQKRQKIDRELDLRIASSQIDEEAQILGMLRARVLSAATRRWQIDPSRPMPTLYCRYRGKGFPLRRTNGRKNPSWRALSPWMKLQVATLALAEGPYIQFTLKLHDDLVDHLVSQGADLRKYLNDRITRRLRGTFGASPPGFLFVAEDQDEHGNQVRPHVHGSIAVPLVDLHDIEGIAAPRVMGKLRRLEAAGKEQAAKTLAGRVLVRHQLKLAGGMNNRARTVAASGIDQRRNVWTKAPMFVALTHHWVNYAFKNEHRFSYLLGDDREAISTVLRAQARDVWEVIRNGDKAVEKIAAR